MPAQPTLNPNQLQSIINHSVSHQQTAIAEILEGARFDSLQRHDNFDYWNRDTGWRGGTSVEH